MSKKHDDYDKQDETKKDEPKKEVKLTTEMVVEALAVHAYLTSATTGDPIAEEHARAACVQADEVIRRFARQQMKLDDGKDS